MLQAPHQQKQLPTSMSHSLLQSHGYNDGSQITPTKESNIVIVPTEEQHTRFVNAPAIHIQSAVAAPTDTQHKNDDTILAKSTANPKESKDAVGNSTTKTRKSSSTDD